ncbi:hypothetical protein BD309DRAFT_1018842 [Dichomitus squalens]|uniref:Uncharacterized protein n=1 Tax=Dichomitus squalens TaxID=114155 RepID=A0A4Q9NWT6_9APHY|nr:hypothetical protein BD309DRAFT_1018842 [Dichomitus squalens]TBU53701.1 hypothetical protein BD310DRAFT_829570 [Dichomitus squalens]
MTLPTRDSSPSTSRTRSCMLDGDNPGLTLETSDGVLFQSCAVLFYLASPVLASQLSSTSSSRPRRLLVPETSTVISIILKIYHPVDEPPSTDIVGIYHALMAAEKYRMQKAVQYLRNALLSKKDDPSTDPVLLYAIGCRCGMRDLAASAAKRTLRMEHESSTSTYAPLDDLGVPASYLHRLLTYQQECREAARCVAEGKWRTQLESACGLGEWADDGKTPCWYGPYMAAIAMQRWPTATSVTAPDLLRGVISSCRSRKDGGGRRRGACSYCSNPEKILLFYDFTKYVAETIEAHVDKVVLTWPESE